MIRRIVLGFLVSTWIGAIPLFAGGTGNPELTAVLTNAISKLDRETAMDLDGAMSLVDLLTREFGTPEDELKWGLDHKISWGEIAVLSYIQATTGKTFAEMNHEDARRNFWAYAENAGMSCEKMAHWLNGFQKRLERERNSRIFDKLRASRKVHPLPDLGSGFGLLQEALDFRRIDSPRPTKIHDLPGELAKGEK